MPDEPVVLNSRFQIDSKIARGGMATVYKGTDLTLGRTVAIKILSDDLAEDPAFVERFRQEARAAAALTHPNIVGVYDTGSDEGRHYIVMEYVRGRTLHDILAQEGSLDPRGVAVVGAQVADALAAAHEKGIVHRDIKPGNVIIEPSGRAKVMDFGIAKAASAQALTQVGSVLGTIAYLSPEQARGEKVDGRSDIYSLGCLLYQMLTGTQPLKADTYPEMVNKLNSARPRPPSRLNSEVPEDLDAVVMRALEKDPADRYQTGAGMADALRRVSGDTADLPAAAVPAGAPDSGSRTVVAGPPGDTGTRVMTERRPPPPPPRNTGKMMVGIAAIVALVAIALVMFNSLRNPVATVEPSPTPQFDIEAPGPAAPPPPPAAEPAESPEPSASPSPSPPPPPPPPPEPDPAPPPPPPPGPPDDPGPLDGLLDGLLESPANP